MVFIVKSNQQLQQSLTLPRVRFIPVLFVPAVAPSLLAMPRCFLAKQSNSNSPDKREWRSNEGKNWNLGNLNVGF